VIERTGTRKPATTRFGKLHGVIQFDWNDFTVVYRLAHTLPVSLFQLCERKGGIHGPLGAKEETCQEGSKGSQAFHVCISQVLADAPCRRQARKSRHEQYRCVSFAGRNVEERFLGRTKALQRPGKTRTRRLQGAHPTMEGGTSESRLG